MNTKVKDLQEALATSRLSYRSIPYIHGALTARAVMPFPDDFEEDEAIVYAILFDEKEKNIPEQGINDPMLQRALDIADTMENEIECAIEGNTFKPFLGEASRQIEDGQIASEWCKGFMAVTVYVMDKPENGAMTDSEAFAFSVLISFALEKSENIPEELSFLLKKRPKDIEKLISDCAYEIDSFWRKREELHYEDDDGDYLDDFHDEPVIREQPKTGRNDPCPCGSGKKYKKCCGKAEAADAGEAAAPLDPEKRDADKEKQLRPDPSSDKRLKTTGGRRCFICGKTKNLVKTPCCGKWICNDEDQYVLFSYGRNSCMRNHRRFTLCGQHFSDGHAGDWKTCNRCREDLSHELEMYVWYGTNEYNYETLSDPPAFKPTFCAKCRKRINLPDGGYTIKGWKYYCDTCEPSSMPRFS